MASSGSNQIESSGYEGDAKQIVEQRKRKRMISNRESARRSRMRKQQRLDDLTAMAAQLKKENGYILSHLNLTNQMRLNVEAENSILRAQMAELTQRLNSLTEIIDCINSTGLGFEGCEDETQIVGCDEDDFSPNWNVLFLNQPVMASSSHVCMY
ncbi:hypothetical protein NMG60_11007935 [Bertholletia excelsa]